MGRTWYSVNDAMKNSRHNATEIRRHACQCTGAASCCSEAPVHGPSRAPRWSQSNAVDPMPEACLRMIGGGGGGSTMPPFAARARI